MQIKVGLCIVFSCMVILFVSCSTFVEAAGTLFSIMLHKKEALYCTAQYNVDGINSIMCAKKALACW